MPHEARVSSGHISREIRDVMATVPANQRHPGLTIMLICAYYQVSKHGTTVHATTKTVPTCLPVAGLHVFQTCWCPYEHPRRGRACCGRTGSDAIGGCRGALLRAGGRTDGRVTPDLWQDHRLGTQESGSSIDTGHGPKNRRRGD
jgi:hypothetical protein